MQLNNSQIIRLINILNINVEVKSAFLQNNMVNLFTVDNQFYPSIPVTDDESEFIINGIKLKRN
jgi:LEA14-like dessication related protein